MKTILDEEKPPFGITIIPVANGFVITYTNSPVTRIKTTVHTQIRTALDEITDWLRDPENKGAT